MLPSPLPPTTQPNQAEAEGKEKRKVNIVDIGKAEDDGKDTLTGYCNLSENLEPCEWTFSTPKIKEKPLMRILF